MADSLPTTSVQDRLQRLQELTEFTETCKKRLDDVFETLGWSWDYNKEMMEQCPFDPDHRVPARSMDRHKASCSLRKMGYSAEEQVSTPASPSTCLRPTNERCATSPWPTGWLCTITWSASSANRRTLRPPATTIFT
ncbi:U11/U12 small nuclear ribonucleoprotein 48 kDa protein [Larimichthys crocea]|uniref:Uncharacterized protein n=1 Tax=Larimichthys crocea TaxID=215358 RepID=A0ACD3QTN4_LARCR|nr:U11/U12 small nuclear ribonucleoprotein 48 kDa protein [Larimichthys crocea]